jgi:hypothetical protein
MVLRRRRNVVVSEEIKRGAFGEGIKWMGLDPALDLLDKPFESNEGTP